uniref:C-type lectin domain-containing protein n=2 Tax=Ciona intestinalis TaxID=7719 RepID=H2XVS9_CIOIN
MENLVSVAVSEQSKWQFFYHFIGLNYDAAFRHCKTVHGGSLLDENHNQMAFVLSNIPTESQYLFWVRSRNAKQPCYYFGHTAYNKSFSFAWGNTCQYIAPFICQKRGLPPPTTTPHTSSAALFAKTEATVFANTSSGATAASSSFPTTLALYIGSLVALSVITLILIALVLFLCCKLHKKKVSTTENVNANEEAAQPDARTYQMNVRGLSNHSDAGYYSIRDPHPNISEFGRG